MTCFSPVQGYESVLLTVNGKRRFTQSKKYARRVDNKLVTMTTACRKCEGCRYDYSREWAVKICHEAQMNGFENSFITLTYNDENCPVDGSLKYKEHWTPFLKRLRKSVYQNYGKTFRFYMVGEYGSVNLRPHYHAILFGFDFPDKYQYLDRLGNILYRSPLLESAWCKPYTDDSYGYSSIGDVTFASAAYVARYSMKKQIGNEFDGFEEYYSDDTGEYMTRPRKSQRYLRYHKITGEPYYVEPERALMSRGSGTGKGGIGKQWFDQYAFTDIYNGLDDGNKIHYRDSVHLDNGCIVRPPKYYDKLLEKVNPDVLQQIKMMRQDHMSCHVDELTPDRLRQKRECLLEKLKYKTRNIGDVYK